MKTIPVFFFISVIALFSACGKDKFETKPRLEIVGYSTRELQEGQDLNIRLKFFDKQGDLSGDSAIGIVSRQNQSVLPPLQDKNDYFTAILPEFPDRQEGEINVKLEYGYLKESLTENDTIILRFAVRDRGGNMSDTVNSERVVIIL